MSTQLSISTQTGAAPTHNWLRPIHLHYRPGPASAMLESVVENLLETFTRLGHTVQPTPDHTTDMVLTTARFDEMINWRRALMFTGRIQLKLDHTPTAYTMIQMTPAEFDDLTGHFAQVLSKEPLDPEDFIFEGMSAEAPGVLIEQGLRGGPILSLMRLLQSRSKCIHIMLVIGEDQAERIYHFDLVGAHPYSERSAGETAFYTDAVLRTVTYESTREITAHEVMDGTIPHSMWKTLETPDDMRRAGLELGNRNFFTEMIKISNLVPVPAITDSISSQYSEGCFVTWEPKIEALIATITGSARPVDKGNITEDDLAVIVGVRPDGEGAQVRHVENKRNDPPSSEAVELRDMDALLPAVQLPGGTDVPVIRSKLHGHRGVSGYDPTVVEYVPLDPPFFHYLVSCATEAQARGIKQAFSRTVSLLNPDDPRLIAFTVLPGHGVVITEKWVEGKAPLQLIWEAMDAGHLLIDNYIPQGLFRYEADQNGQMRLKE